MGILRYLKPVAGNNLLTPDKAGLSTRIIEKMDQSIDGERAIANNRRALDKGTIGKYNRPYCS